MDGRTFWDIFVGARIPDKELMALGEDIGYMRGALSQGGQAALLKLGFALKMRGSIVTSQQIFTALKREMPGIFSRKGLLMGLASQYDDRVAYGVLRPDVRGYIDDVAAHLPPATKAAKPDIAVHTSKPTKPEWKPTLAPDKPPEGLTMDEYNLLQAVVRKLGDPKTSAQVTAPQLAAARNLAARGKMGNTLRVLDQEIARRGEGAQDGTTTVEEPSRAGFGKAGVIAILALFFFFLRR